MCDVTESDLGWNFVFSEGVVTQLRVDNEFCLLLDGGEQIVIAEPFILKIGQSSEIVPSGPESYTVGFALPLFNKRIIDANAGHDGVLRVTFSDGSDITVPVNRSFENWRILAPDGSAWIGLPGGGVHATSPSAKLPDLLVPAAFAARAVWGHCAERWVSSVVLCGAIRT